MKKKQLEILYQDDQVVVVNKAYGMLSIPDRFKKGEDNLRTLLEQKFGKIFVVHRLDRDTSGVMVFALNAESHRNLSIQFEKHTVDKKYLAVVAGIMAKDDLDVDIPLMPNPRIPGTMMPSARGKASFTHIHVLERFRVATLIECTLKTGRQHQLRVHCAAVGYPMLVDSVYGRSDSFQLSAIKRRFRLQKDEEEKPLIQRTTLHAHSLSFIHPVSGERLSFVAEPPKDFKALLTVLRKYSASYAAGDQPFSGRSSSISDAFTDDQL